MLDCRDGSGPHPRPLNSWKQDFNQLILLLCNTTFPSFGLTHAMPSGPQLFHLPNDQMTPKVCSTLTHPLGSQPGKEFKVPLIDLIASQRLCTPGRRLRGVWAQPLPSLLPSQAGVTLSLHLSPHPLLSIPSAPLSLLVIALTSWLVSPHLSLHSLLSPSLPYLNPLLWLPTALGIHHNSLTQPRRATTWTPAVSPQHSPHNVGLNKELWGEQMKN